MQFAHNGPGLVARPVDLSFLDLNGRSPAAAARACVRQRPAGAAAAFDSADCLNHAGNRGLGDFVAIEAIGRIEGGGSTGRPLSYASPGGGSWRPAIKIEERAINWSCDETGTVMRKLHAASGPPGIPDITLGLSGRLNDPWPEDVLRGPAGAVIAWRDGAICRATVDGAVWITAITPEPAPSTRRFKIPATLALAGRLDNIPERPVGPATGEGPKTFREISY